MAMSHADCDHPRTPAARAACRRRGILHDQRVRVLDAGQPTGSRNTPRRIIATHHPLCTSPAGHNTPGCPVPAGTPAMVTTPRKGRRSGGNVDVKRPGTRLRTIGDLPDVPRMLAHGCRIAWDRGWDVKVGECFNDVEKRIVVNGDRCEVSLVWRPSLPDGVWGVFVRRYKHPIMHRIDAGVEHALRIAAGEEPFEWHGL